MKQTDLLMNESFLETLNPSYYQYAITHFLEEQEQNKDQEVQSSNHHSQERLFSDFQVTQDLNQENQGIEELGSKYMWAHLTCAYWLPECFFTADNRITGLPNVDKKRFNLTCNICKIKKSGACIQCSRGKCCVAFHPECARRAQLFMESKEQPEGYMIYCEKHMPLKLKRIIENRTKSHIEEIQCFYRHIEKNHQHFMTQNRINSAKKSVNHRTQQIEIELEIKAENQSLLAELTEFVLRTRVNKICIVLSKINDKEYVVSQIQEPMIESEIMSIPGNDSIWSQFKFHDFTPEQIYRLYRRAVRMNKPIRKIKQRQIVDFSELKKIPEKKMAKIKQPKIHLQMIKQQKKLDEESVLKFRIPKFLIGSDNQNNNHSKKMKYDQLLDYDQQLHKRRRYRKWRLNKMHSVPKSHNLENEKVELESASFEMQSIFDVDKISVRKQLKRF